MNVIPGSGLKINENDKGWFNKNYINFKYRGNRNFVNWIFP